MPPRRSGGSVRVARVAPARKSSTVELPPFTPSISFIVSAGSPASARAEALVVFAFEGSKRIEGVEGGKLRAFVESLAASDGFRAKRGRTLLCHAPAGSGAKRVIVAGLGRREAYDADAIRSAAATAALRAGGAGAGRVTYSLPPAEGGESSAGRRVSALVEGCLLGAYRFIKYLTGESLAEEGRLRRGEILVPRDLLAEARRAARLAEIGCAATNLARDLVNEPAVSLTPTRMAAIAKALSARAGLECRIHDERALERMGMGAFLGVARGSHEAPRLIHLIYRPSGKVRRKIALVGKGITFDSGGLSLKTSSGMETMKLDKAGSVAVLAAMLTLKEVRPKAEIHGLLGMTENMPGGSAMKPGDVVRTAGGKTIEVLNTDAEGRLVLADLLSYTRGLGVDEVVDLATLTGACMIALGPFAGGLFASDDALCARLLEASRVSGEKLWRLPLYEEYTHQLRSEVADVKNTADRYGSAITAALFLREFVEKGTPWAHLDIAGPAFLESTQHPYMRRGATGMGVRTLLAYLSTYA